MTKPGQHVGNMSSLISKITGLRQVPVQIMLSSIKARRRVSFRKGSPCGNSYVLKT